LETKFYPKVVSEYLAKHGVTKSSLAKEIGVSTKHLSNWLSGSVEPDIEQIANLYRFCEIPFNAVEWCLAQLRESLTSSFDGFASQLGSMLRLEQAERDNALTATQSQLLGLETNTQTLQTERDALIAERDELLAERDALLAQIEKQGTERSAETTAQAVDNGENGLELDVPVSLVFNEDKQLCRGLTPRQIKQINKIRDLSSVAKLSRVIYDFPLELVKKASAVGLSVLEYAEQQTIDITEFAGALRDYQTVGAAFMLYSSRSIIGDDVGLGKTVCVAAVINYCYSSGELGGKRVLISTETNAVEQFAAEMRRFTGLSVVVFESATDKLDKQLDKLSDFDIAVIKHSTLKSDLFYTWFAESVENHESSMFGMFVLDESSVVKNANTQTYKYVEQLCATIPRVHFLNATVFETSILDIYAQVNLVYPGLVPSEKWVKNNFCIYQLEDFYVRGGKGAKQKKYSLVGYKHQDEFKRAIGLVYFGRNRADVNLSVVERAYRVIPIKPTLEQQKAIRKGYRYFEVYNCPSLCESLEIHNTVEDVPKFAALMDLFRNELKDQQVLVYVWHVEIQQDIVNALRELGVTAEFMNGGTKDRADVQNRFNSGETRVLITNVKRAVNLHAGDVCVLYSVETNPAKLEQIAGRIDRNVDDKSKTFIMLAYEGEELNFFTNVVSERANNSALLVGTTSNSVTGLTEALDY
jgi:SNF2 family DNA or RNA helicase